MLKLSRGPKGLADQLKVAVKSPKMTWTKRRELFGLHNLVRKVFPEMSLSFKNLLLELDGILKWVK
jgi:hypothetical protein